MNAQVIENRNIIKKTRSFDASAGVVNYLKGISGQLYKIELAESKTEMSEAEELEDYYSEAELAEVRTCTEIQKPFQCKSENFAGCARRQVKTSYSKVALKSYTLKELLDKLDQAKYKDATIKAKLKNFPNKQTKRLPEEDQSVTISNVYLFAIKQLPDNDYHMIVCDKEKKRFLTVELSGLPDNVSHTSPLKKARDEFNDKFVYEVSCNGKYVVFTDIIYPIKFITGTLFFDVNHDGGSIGPQNYPGPTTAWEIHPVTAIKFGDPIEN
jgi:hypothetical protein